MGTRQLPGEVLAVVVAAAMLMAACGGGGIVNSDDLTSQSLSAAAAAPEAPSALTATATSTSEISLKWQDNSPNETGFLIETRTSTAAAYATVATVAANVTTYQHKGLQSATKYLYHVRSCIESKCSERPAEASAETQGPVIPAGVPTVSTREASSVAGHAATTGGTVTPNKLATTTWVEYGTSATLAGATATAAKSAGDGTAAFAFEQRVEGLLSGTTYYYRAVASNSAGRVNGSIRSFTTSVEPPPAPPAPLATAPQAVQAADDPAAMAVSLSWTHDGANGVSYVVRRRNASETSFLAVATLPNSARSYKDASYELQSRHEYVYRVDACKNDDCVASSTVAITTAMLAAPTNLVATVVSATSVTLTWTDNSTQEDGFIVSRRAGEGSFVTAATPAAGATSLTITGLSAGERYTFKVLAFKGASADGSRRSTNAELVWTNPKP